jgi:putative ABC transport system permease protein
VLRTTLRSFWAHKRRLASTVVAVVLGVAFMAGTLVLSDTLDRVFDDLFAAAGENVDAQVQGVSLFSEPGGGEVRELLDPALVDAVLAVDGVARAEAFVTTIGFGSSNRVLDPEGEPVGATRGPPTLIESWLTDPELSPYVVTQGRGPEADDELALNVGAVESAGFDVGDAVTVVTQHGPTEYTLVGTFTFGTAKSAAGAVSAEFTLREAQRLAGTGEQVQVILAGAEDGISQEELVERVTPVLPPEAEVLTGAAASEQLSSEVQSGLAFFSTGLQIFAGIALLVGAFVIANTFAILVAQRTRELALLRTVGASRGQVLGSVLLEAVLVGLVAAALGLGAGVGLAKLVTVVLDAAGADLPTATLVISAATVAVAFVVGVTVTLLAAMVPAWHATQVPPLAALRDVAVDRSAASRPRAVGGVLILVVGGFALSAAWRRDGGTDVLPTVGLGAALLLVGAVVIGPVLAGRSVKVVGWALPRVAGVTGRLALENAARSPKRTSASASALLIGVALVGFITVFAASAKDSVVAEVDRGFVADLVVQSDAGGFGPPSGFPSEVADLVAGVDGIDLVSAVGFGGAELTFPDGTTGTQFVTAVDPATLLQVVEPRMDEGAVEDLSPAGVVMDRQVAERNGVTVGDRVLLRPPRGEARELVVEAISDDVTLLGFVTIDRATFQEAFPEPLDAQVIATVAPGADVAAVQAAVQDAVAGTPSLAVLDRDGFVGDLTDQITSFVNIIYGLLLLSIVIAAIGIANTLSLSISERTRELGLLRAVGMDRGQLRAAIRWEAILISVLGTVIGLGLGLLLSWALVRSLEGFGLSRFSVPVGSLAVIVVLAALLGTLAALRPARRAARLDVLEAIATE